MDYQILIGLLGVAGTVSAPLIALKYSERRKYSAISKTRISHLAEHSWSGYFVLDNKKKQNAEFIFNVKGRSVQGSATYEPSSGKTKIVFEGGFQTDNILKLEYRNSHQHKLHFGTMILEINGDSNVLKGGLVVYGRDPDRVYFGRIVLEST